MNPALNRKAVADWHAGTMTVAELADGLACDLAVVAALLGSAGIRCLGGSALEGSASAVSARLRVALSIAVALHREFRVSLADAAEIAGGCSARFDAVLATIDFFPPSGKAPLGDSARASAERDPLKLFVPQARDELPIVAIDEFLDLADGSRIFWRKPRHDAYRLAGELYRLSMAAKGDDTPALQEEYLEALCRLRQSADHVAEFIGSIVDGRFKPAMTRRDAPAMRQGPNLAVVGGSLAECYRTKVSLNVSLGVRSLKRRLLGLPVSGASRP